jgi:hypothetical protein
MSRNTMGEQITQPDPQVHGAADPSGAAAPGAAMTDAILDALHNRSGKSRAVKNQRSSERHSWVTDVTIDVGDLPRESRTIHVTTYDISRGGFSFIHNQFICAGVRLRLTFDSLPGSPIIIGIVRNCFNVGGMLHRVGVQFERSEPSSSPA